MIEKMKVVHVVTTASEKTVLLDRLQKLGVVHFSEKASADQQYLQRFNDLSRMVTILQEYAQDAPESSVMSDSDFEKFFAELEDCLDRKKSLQDQQSAAHAGNHAHKHQQVQGGLSYTAPHHPDAHDRENAKARAVH